MFVFDEIYKIFNINRGGLRNNDIIIKVNGDFVETPKDMYEILNIKKELELSVLRNGEYISVKVIGLEIDSKV